MFVICHHSYHSYPIQTASIMLPTPQSLKHPLLPNPNPFMLVHYPIRIKRNYNTYTCPCPCSTISPNKCCSHLPESACRFLLRIRNTPPNTLPNHPATPPRRLGRCHLPEPPLPSHDSLFRSLNASPSNDCKYLSKSRGTTTQGINNLAPRSTLCPSKAHTIKAHSTTSTFSVPTVVTRVDVYRAISDI